MSDVRAVAARDAGRRTEASTVNDRTRVLVVGGASPLAQALSRDLILDGAAVTLGGLDPKQALAHIPRDLRGHLRAIKLDVGDELSVAAAARTLGPFDYVVSVPATHAIGPVKNLARTAIVAAFDAKVFGPMLLAKHFTAHIRSGGGFIFFFGVAAQDHSVGSSILTITNAAVRALVEALAVELAPTRIVAISPGLNKSPAWAAMGDDCQTVPFDGTAQTNPFGRVGTMADVVKTVRTAMADKFLTGTFLHVDGGQGLA